MRPSSASPAITTPHINASRDFYQKYLGARLIFDCGWFINLEFGKGLSVQFMEPQGDQPACVTSGLTYNFCVEDVDAEYQRLIESGLVPDNKPEDHPWGDRGFSIEDPNGIMLYIYSDREPSPEFKSAYVGKSDT
jgi:catechol 2,3-dioxygenase-like lactoylglutathione lyase family enzyme